MCQVFRRLSRLCRSCQLCPLWEMSVAPGASTPPGVLPRNHCNKKSGGMRHIWLMAVRRPQSVFPTSAAAPTSSRRYAFQWCRALHRLASLQRGLTSTPPRGFKREAVHTHFDVCRLVNIDGSYLRRGPPHHEILTSLKRIPPLPPSWYCYRAVKVSIYASLLESAALPYRFTAFSHLLEHATLYSNTSPGSSRRGQRLPHPEGTAAVLGTTTGPARVPAPAMPAAPHSTPRGNAPLPLRRRRHRRMRKAGWRRPGRSRS